MLEGKTVHLKLMQRDQYGRAIAIVTVPTFIFFSKDISQKQLEKGMAVMYHGKDACYGDNKSLYAASEKKAKNSKTGIWSQGNFTTPAEHKRAMRE